MCSRSMMSHDLFVESHGRTGQGWENSEVIRWSESSLLTSDVRTLAKCSPQAVTVSGGQLPIVAARTFPPQCSYLYLPVKLQQDCLDRCGGEVDIPIFNLRSPAIWTPLNGRDRADGWNDASTRRARFYQ